MIKLLRHAPILLAIAVAVAAAAFVTLRVLGSGAPPDGPVAVVWDHEICAHCRMHIGEPGFAAQLQTDDGAVFSFDDPGCAVLFLDGHDPSVHALYFRHHREPRWLPEAGTAFVHVAQSPMGYGYGAVDAGAPDSEPLAKLRERVTQGMVR